MSRTPAPSFILSPESNFLEGGNSHTHTHKKNEEIIPKCVSASPNICGKEAGGNKWLPAVRTHFQSVPRQPPVKFWK